MPLSVRSNIHEIVDSVYERGRVTVSTGKGKDGQEQLAVSGNLSSVIKELESQMREAATYPEFDKAAGLRDQVKRLRQIEPDTLEGGIL
jgi:excinuclease ABC subunit B